MIIYLCFALYTYLFLLFEDVEYCRRTNKSPLWLELLSIALCFWWVVAALLTYYILKDIVGRLRGYKS